MDLSGVQRVSDVAGASGIYSITLAQCQPMLSVVVLDLPASLHFAQEIIACHGMQELVSPQPGNYFHGGFADGYDLVLLSNIMQTEGVKTCQLLLGKVFKALS